MTAHPLCAATVARVHLGYIIWGSRRAAHSAPHAPHTYHVMFPGLTWDQSSVYVAENESNRRVGLSCEEGPSSRAPEPNHSSAHPEISQDFTRWKE